MLSEFQLVCLTLCMSVHVSVCPSACPPVCLSACLLAGLSVWYNSSVWLRVQHLRLAAMLLPFSLLTYGAFCVTCKPSHVLQQRIVSLLAHSKKTLRKLWHPLEIACVRDRLTDRLSGDRIRVAGLNSSKRQWCVYPDDGESTLGPLFEPDQTDTAHMLGFIPKPSPIESYTCSSCN